MNAAVRYREGRQELAMHPIVLVIFAAIAVPMFAGLSMTLYTLLPQFVLDCGARHGRFAVLGASGRADRPRGGSTLVSDYEPLQGQSA
jgi:hypothetical protein